MKAKYLKFLRLVVGYTQADLASKIGVSQVMISHWELQKRTLDETRMRKILGILGARGPKEVNGETHPNQPA